MTDYEPYVSDPVEPPRRRRMAGAAPAVWSLAVLVLVIALATLFLQGRGQEDPALTVPSETPTEEPQRDGGGNGGRGDGRSDEDGDG